MTAEASPRSHPAERMAAMTGYALMIVAPFTLNTLGLAAVAIGYARRDYADRITRTHYDRQIRSFWLHLMMVGLGFICGSGALAAGFGALLAGALLELGVRLPWHYDPVHIGVGAIGLLVAWLLLWVWGLLGLMIGSLIGAARLAQGLPAGRIAR
jgi:uncharacterized membrane protein